MQSVGGWARITSWPGHGTRVHLVWPWLDEQHLDTDDGSHTARQVLTRTAWPNLALAPFFTALLSPLVSPQWPVVLATLLLVAAGAASIWWLRRHPMGLLHATLLAGISMAVWATNLWTAPDHTRVVHYLWLCWGCASLAHLVVLQQRLWQAILALAGWAASMLALLMARFGPGLDLAALHPVVSIDVGEGLVSLMVFHSARRISNVAAMERHQARALRREADRLQAMTHLDDHWSRRVTGAPGQQVTLSGAADRMTAVVLAPSRSQRMRWARIFAVGSMPGEQVQVDADEDFARITVQRPAAVLGPVRGTSAW